MSAETYQDRGYGQGRVGFGAKPGIAVVDFQRAFTDKAFALGGSDMVERAVDNTAKLLERARAANVPVASCYTAYSSPRDVPHWKLPIIAEEFIHGHPCTEMEPRVYNRDYDAVFCKRGPSIFFETGAVQYFVKERVDTIVIAGCTTSGCVRASVIDAFSYGYRVIVPEPCVGDMAEGPHHANLDDVGRRYADVTDLEEVEQAIEAFRGRNAD